MGNDAGSRTFDERMAAVPTGAGARVIRGSQIVVRMRGIVGGPNPTWQDTHTGSVYSDDEIAGWLAGGATVQYAGDPGGRPADSGPVYIRNFPDAGTSQVTDDQGYAAMLTLIDGAEQFGISRPELESALGDGVTSVRLHSWLSRAVMHNRVIIGDSNPDSLIWSHRGFQEMDRARRAAMGEAADRAATTLGASGDAVANGVDPALAVDRALNDTERDRFRTRVLAGPYDGMEPADWLDEAMNADAYEQQIGQWWDALGDMTVAAIRDQHGLPEKLTRGLVHAAAYAHHAIRDTADPDGLDLPRATEKIAAAAALWARGYAEGRGWSRA